MQPVYKPVESLNFYRLSLYDTICKFRNRVNISRVEVAKEIVGVFFMPQEINRPAPALIVLGGSEGAARATSDSWLKVIEFLRRELGVK